MKGLENWRQMGLENWTDGDSLSSAKNCPLMGYFFKSVFVCFCQIGSNRSFFSYEQMSLQGGQPTWFSEGNSYEDEQVLWQLIIWYNLSTMLWTSRKSKTVLSHQMYLTIGASYMQISSLRLALMWAATSSSSSSSTSKRSLCLVAMRTFNFAICWSTNSL